MIRQNALEVLMEKSDRFTVEENIDFNNYMASVKFEEIMYDAGTRNDTTEPCVVRWLSYDNSEFGKKIFTKYFAHFQIIKNIRNFWVELTLEESENCEAEGEVVVAVDRTTVLHQITDNNYFQLAPYFSDNTIFAREKATARILEKYTPKSGE